jgi:hypothetical protein
VIIVVACHMVIFPCTTLIWVRWVLGYRFARGLVGDVVCLVCRMCVVNECESARCVVRRRWYDDFVAMRQRGWQTDLWDLAGYPCCTSKVWLASSKIYFKMAIAL